MPVRAPAGWITRLHSSLARIFTSLNFSSFGNILHCSAVCPGLGEGESDCLPGTELQVVHLSCWVDPPGQMPVNTLRRWPQAYFRLKQMYNWIYFVASSDPDIKVI